MAAGLFASLTGTLGCSTVVFVRKPETRTFSGPSYESSRPFFFFGLLAVGPDVSIDQVCLGKDVDQISTTYASGDVLAAIFTAGIYSPRTIKVWCKL